MCSVNYRWVLSQEVWKATREKQKVVFAKTYLSTSAVISYDSFSQNVNLLPYTKLLLTIKKAVVNLDDTSKGLLYLIVNPHIYVSKRLFLSLSQQYTVKI